MSRKMIDPVEEGRRGGNITKERHGTSHFSKAGKIGRANLLKRDPEYAKRLVELMYHGRQLKLQARIAEALGERFKIAPDRNESPKFFDKLLGQG